jgi:hypothetical protein
MTSSISRRQLLIAAGVGAIGTAAAVGTAPSVLAEEQGEDPRVEGGWYVTVEVTQPSPAMFDALYGFAQGGVFTRIDGRNNAPAVGTWKRAEDGAIIFSNILFNFVAGVRTGYITGKFSARVVDGTLIGTFTAEGHGIPGFLPRIGTFTGTRIVPEAP